MISPNIHSSLCRALVALVLVATLLYVPALAADPEDSQIFIAGFNAYHKRQYPTTVERMNTLLQKYPDSSLRDIALYWLSKAYYRNGDQQQAARYMAQFLHDYPDSPLKATVDDDLLKLATLYAKGKSIPPASPEKEASSAAKGQ